MSVPLIVGKWMVCIWSLIKIFVLEIIMNGTLVVSWGGRTSSVHDTTLWLLIAFLRQLITLKLSSCTALIFFSWRLGHQLVLCTWTNFIKYHFDQTKLFYLLFLVTICMLVMLHVVPFCQKNHSMHTARPSCGSGTSCPLHSPSHYSLIGYWMEAACSELTCVHENNTNNIYILVVSSAFTLCVHWFNVV